MSFVTRPPTSRMPAPAGLRGFTLIELMVALVVAAVLLAAAGPGLGSFIRSSQLNAAQSELVSSMMLARSEAAKRGQDVQLIAANARNGTDFSSGWVIWWDKNGDGQVDASSGSEEVLRIYPAPGGATIRAQQAAPWVRFSPTGFLSPLNAVAFTVCGRTGQHKGYAVTLQPVGLADISPLNACS